MGVEWPSVAIGDVAEVFDGPHATPKTVDSGPIFLGIGALQSGRINLGETRHVTPEDFTTWTRRVKPQGGDVVFSYETRLGEAALIPDDFECCLGRRMGLVRTKRERLDPRFFLYLYLSPYFQELIRSRTIPGATVDRIALKEFPSFPIPLPEISEQRAIAHILGTLDDKIELNRRRNQTLEAMARALFKDWFVDFGPVRAKCRGEPPCSPLSGQAQGPAPTTPYLPADLWQLFPDRLDDEGKPEGWRRSTIGSEVTVCGGSTPSTKEPAFWEGGEHHWATPKDLSALAFPVLLDTDRKITDAGVAKISSGLLPVGTVLLSSRAPIGYLAIAEVPTAINQGFIAMKCDGALPNVFVLFWCRENMDLILGNANGSTFQEISKSNFRPIPVIVPPEPILNAFRERAGPVYRHIVENERESKALAQLRDTLLPKLISGELRIKDAENFIKDVSA